MTEVSDGHLPFISKDDTLMDTLAVIDKYAKGIALVVQEDRLLLGTVSDGDIRRAILRGESLDNTVMTLLVKKASTQYPQPVAATTYGDLFTLLNESGLNQVPLLDNTGRVIDLITRADLTLGDVPTEMDAVIMAGGFGTRLRPLTEDVPKPMLPVGDKPLMEQTVARLKQAGISKINVTTHYKPEKIYDHFGDGHKFGVDINYIAEEQPMGTAGGLTGIESGDKPLLIINGDIVTNVDFKSVLQFHKEHEAEMTIGVRQYKYKVPYGVVESVGLRVSKITEKPDYSFFVNAGIYIIEPQIIDMIPKDRRYDMTDLAGQLLENDHMVVSFPIIEYWLDIGQPADYEKAQQFAKDSGGDN